MLVWLGGKEPNELADFDIDWSDRLANPNPALPSDTIASSVWVIVDGDAPASGTLSIQSNTFLAARTKVWLSAGNDGIVYELRNTVTTANGDTLIENVQLLVKHR